VIGTAGLSDRHQPEMVIVFTGIRRLLFCLRVAAVVALYSPGRAPGSKTLAPEEWLLEAIVPTIISQELFDQV
jgi:hypothetical protein